MTPSKLYARVIAVPPNLPADDLKTADLFAQCVGRSFEVNGRNGPLLELAVGEVRGEALIMHSIWIEPQLTELSLDNSRQKSITLQMLSNFARTARERMRMQRGGYRRDHFRALAQRVEVDTGEARIMGS